MADSYLQRTLSSGNRKKFTVSAWVKRSKLGAQQIKYLETHQLGITL